MKTTLKIAKAELRNLFYSPIAWLVLAIFIFQTSFSFFNILQTVVRAQERIPMLYSVVEIFNNPKRGLFREVLGNLYLYIPLLTMGIMSREISSGTIKLLLSSPIKIRSILFGKFLGMVIYGLLILSILLFFAFIISAHVPGFQIEVILTGVLGLYLLVATYIAIGMFLSSLTSYQVVAAIATLIVLSFLNYIGFLGQKIAFVREITYYLSMNGRIGNFMLGLITTKDVCYYLIIIALFLSFTWLRLHFITRSVKTIKKVMAYSGVIVITSLCIFITTRPKLIGYYDTTSNKQNSLSDESMEIISKFETPPKITVYANLMAGTSYQRVMPDKTMADHEFLRTYVRYMPELRMDYKYYYHKVPYVPNISSRLIQSLPGENQSTSSSQNRAMNRSTQPSTGIKFNPKEFKRLKEEYDQLRKSIGPSRKPTPEELKKLRDIYIALRKSAGPPRKLTPEEVKKLREKYAQLRKNATPRKKLSPEEIKKLREKYAQLRKRPNVKDTSTVTSNRISKNSAAKVKTSKNNQQNQQRTELLKAQAKLRRESFTKQIEKGTPEQAARAKASKDRVDLNLFAPYKTVEKEADLAKTNFGLVRVLKYKEKTAQLRFTSEANVSAALKNLLVGIPKILFTTGHYENSPYDKGQMGYAKYFRDLYLPTSLINHGFDVDTINILKQELPTDLAMLVIADPKTSFSPEELARLHRYIAAGGNLLFAGNPGKEIIANPVLAPTGASLLKGKVMQYNSFTPGKVHAKYIPNNNYEFTKNMHIYIMLIDATGVSYTTDKGFHVYPLLESDPKNTWLRTKETMLDSVAPKFLPENSDRNDKIPLAICMIRKVGSKLQKIMVAGDAEFFNNRSKDDDGPQIKNERFAPSMAKWFSNNEFPLSILRNPIKDDAIDMDSEKVKNLKALLLYPLPSSIALLAIFLLIKRKRK